MLNKPVFISLIATLTTLALPGQAPQGAQVNLSGLYRCEPEPAPCPWPTMSITQSGSDLDLKNENGSVAPAKLTSDITLSGGPPWNAIGIVLPDHSIQWSNGTHWRKQ
jgi:hypothetical protein